MKKIIITVGWIFAIYVVGAVGYTLDEKIKILNEKIDGIDDAVFQHMKEEFNSKVSDNN